MTGDGVGAGSVTWRDKARIATRNHFSKVALHYFTFAFEQGTTMMNEENMKLWDGKEHEEKEEDTAALLEFFVRRHNH